MHAMDGSIRLAALVAGALAVGACCATALAATSGRASARSGPVAATITYLHDVKSAVAPYSDLRLTIVRAGKTLVSGPVTSGLCDTGCWPVVPGALRVLDVEADGEPDVLLNLYSGGAHCCNVTEVFRYDAVSGTYHSLTHIWGDPAYTLERLDGSGPYEWLTQDDRFAYEFAAYAFSGLPLEILRLSGGVFRDVTARYPARVTLDAADQWKYYLSNESGEADGGLGYLAAWAADEYTLGRGAFVTKRLAQLLSSGGLRSTSGFPWVGGARFVAQLERFLRKTGYAH
jgi:hypothetical protein